MLFLAQKGRPRDKMPLKLTLGQKRSLFLLLVLAAAGTFCFFNLHARPTPPNVVLITIDALRADHLGCYGYKRDTSPNIDALAREGALFPQAIAQSSHTPPSMGTIATSTYPPTNQLHVWGNSLKPDIPTLAEVLKAHGYKTVFADGNGNFRKGLRGLEKGFDIFYDQGVTASVLTQTALELVGRNGPKPFFLWIHYMDVHDYNPPKEFESFFINDQFYDRQKKLPIVGNHPGTYGFNGISECMAEKRGRNDNPDYYVALYDGALRYVDGQIRSLLHSLKRTDRGMMVIVTSDHGEMFGEHGYYFHHGWFLYEPLIRVPLILRYAHVIPMKRVASQISAGLDVFPTILDILGIKKPTTVQGVGLLNVLSGKDEGPSSVFSDEGGIRESVRTNEWKLIRFNEKKGLPEIYKLYRLKTDPNETGNLVSSAKETFLVLKGKLDKYREDFPDTRMAAPVLDQESRKKLRSLGYLQ